MHQDSGRPLAEPAFEWKDYSRFVAIYAVERGWLVVWGKYEDLGARKLVYGQQTYRDLAGVKHRLAIAVVELTADPRNIDEAMWLLRHRGLPEHTPKDLPEPLG
jgi:hypothetical protein